MFWNLVGFEDLIRVYFDFIDYDRVDIRDVIWDSINRELPQTLDTTDKYTHLRNYDDQAIWSAIDGFVRELESHLSYFFGEDQASMFFSKLHENVLVLEIKNLDDQYITTLSGRYNPGYTQFSARVQAPA